MPCTAVNVWVVRARNGSSRRQPGASVFVRLTKALRSSCTSTILGLVGLISLLWLAAATRVLSAGASTIAIVSLMISPLLSEFEETQNSELKTPNSQACPGAARLLQWRCARQRPCAGSPGARQIGRAHV